MDIIAHRCGTDKYPELTIASARHSLDIGAAYAELDVRFTQNGYPVVNHDSSCDYLFGFKKRVADINMEEFLSLRHKSDVSFTAHSLEHFFENGIDRILLHIKEGGDRLGQIYELCHKYGFEERVVFGVQSVDDIKAVKDFNINSTVLAFMPDESDLNSFAAAGADIIRLWEQWVSPQNIESIKNMGKKVWIMANNRDAFVSGCGYTSENNLMLWNSWGVDGILLNNVQWAITLLNN